jgi:hypothetical protein
VPEQVEYLLVTEALLRKRRVQSVVENDGRCAGLRSLREIEKRVRRQCRYLGSDKADYGSEGVNIEEAYSLRYFILFDTKVVTSKSSYGTA